MLNGVPISTNDSVWAGILADLGGRIRAARGIEFTPPGGKISAANVPARARELASEHLSRLGAEKLSEAEQRLLLFLPGTAAELKAEMGYAEDSATHTVETLIYNIRKKLGKNFVKLRDGQYRL